MLSPVVEKNLQKMAADPEKNMEIMHKCTEVVEYIFKYSKDTFATWEYGLWPDRISEEVIHRLSTVIYSKLLTEITPCVLEELK